MARAEPTRGAPPGPGPTGVICDLRTRAGYAVQPDLVQAEGVSSTTADRISSLADPGWFGPDSVSWRVHHDPAILVGGLRALMLQSLHPDVMLQFHKITDARADPWGRLGRTAQYVDVVVFGTRDEADEASARVRRVHRALGLDRQDWLLWVHCAAVDSWLRAYEVSGGRLDPGDGDRYLTEQVRAGELVGCDPATVPRTRAELATYFEQIRPQLAVTPGAREAVRGVLWPPMPARVALATPARPLWTLAATTAFGLLPRWARRMFALPGLPPTDVAAGLTARALRAGMLLVPERRRTSPQAAAARARLSR